MRAPRQPDSLFWVAPDRVTGATVRLDRDESHHLLRVHRAEAGALFEATDGEGTLYRCRLLEAAGPEASGEIVERVSNAGELAAALHLVVGLPDARAAESIVEHGVPLGAASIRFVGCRRSGRALPGDATLERLGRIAIAGVKQSRRSRLPQILASATLGEAIGRIESGLRLVADPRGGGIFPPTPNTAQPIVNLAVGPPGGFDDAELAALRGQGFEAMSLGPNRLTTETASIAFLSIARNWVSSNRLPSV